MTIFTELALVLSLAAILSLLLRALRQPLVIAYIITGILTGPYFFNLLSGAESLELFSKIGIAILLFIVGLNLSPKVVEEVGKTSLFVGLGQILFTTLVGFSIITLLGIAAPGSFFLAIALSFASTIIGMKLLGDRGDLGKLYGKISIGFLLVQDIVATLSLIAISAFAESSGNTSLSIFSLIGKGLVAIFILYVISKYIIPKIGEVFAASQELLFLFSIAWGLGIASLFALIGFSIEIGALAAGVILSLTPFAHEIGAKMKTLRDFFIVLFFILLGSQMVFADFSQALFPAIILSLFILIGNPLIIMWILNLLGYKRKTAFQASLLSGQISEFSLILIALAAEVGHVDQYLVSLITLVALMTMGASTYLILYSDSIYGKISRFLKIFEVKNNDGKRERKFSGHEIALFGFDRVGEKFLTSFAALGKKSLVIDFNPAAIRKLAEKNIDNIYGDAEDVEFLEDLYLPQFRLIVSTIPDFRVNFILTGTVRKKNHDAIVITIAENKKEAGELYEAGATYVIIPHHLGAAYAAEMIEKYGFDRNLFEKERARHPF